MTTYLTATKCRACGSDNLTELFSLGEQYVSDFVKAEEVFDGPKVPITLDRCNACTLVQARHSLPPESLYSQQYWYKSGTTATMQKALGQVVQAAHEIIKVGAGDVVLDIGSNDGTLLKCWPKNCIKVGVEPAPNLVKNYEQDGLDLVNGLWSAASYFKHVDSIDCEAMWSNRAKVITACGMFYDLEDPNQFIADAAKVLHPEGVFIAQLMCLKQMVLKCDVGNLAHEHLEFYTLDSLQVLFAKHGLVIFDIEENDVNGGSYRIYVQHADEHYRTSGHPSRMTSAGFSKVIAAFKSEEPLITGDAMKDFYSLAESNRNNCVDAIRNIVRNGKRVMVYGASTKGNVILQWYGLNGFCNGVGDRPLIEAAADRDPAKWGLVTAGSGIPIISEEEARQRNPDFFLVLPYAFLDEFLVREKAWRDGGGRFIVPLPQFKVV